MRLRRLGVPLPLVQYDMSGPYRDKVRYYAQFDVIDWVAKVYPGLPCEFGVGVLNWRGSLHHESSALLRRLGVSAEDETLLSIRVLTYTATMLKHRTRSTMSGKRPRGSQPSQVPGI